MKKTTTAGVMMIELLFAMGLIGFVLFTLFIDQITLLKNIRAIQYQATASVQLVNFSEVFISIKSSDAIQSFFSVWNNDLTQLIPQGMGEWHMVSPHQCEISIRWFYQKAMEDSLICAC